MKRPAIDPALLVILAGVCAALHVGKLPPALPVLRDALGVSLLQAGFLLSMVQLAGMTLGLAVGLTADSFGLRRSMLLGLWTLAGASAAGGWARGPGDLLALRALEGFGLSAGRAAGPQPDPQAGSHESAQYDARAVGRVHAFWIGRGLAVRPAGDGACRLAGLVVGPGGLVGSHGGLAGARRAAGRRAPRCRGRADRAEGAHPPHPYRPGRVACARRSPRAAPGWWR